MSRARFLRIWGCSGCGCYAAPSSSSRTYWCYGAGREIPDHNHIPDWCPLPKNGTDEAPTLQAQQRIAELERENAALRANSEEILATSFRVLDRAQKAEAELAKERARECRLREALDAARSELGRAEGRLRTIDAMPDNGYGRAFNGDIIPGIGAAFNKAHEALTATAAPCPHQTEAERLAIAFSSDAFQCINGIVPASEALNVPGLVAIHDAEVRAETLRAAAKHAEFTTHRGSVPTLLARELRDLADLAERGEWPKQGTEG